MSESLLWESQGEDSKKTWSDYVSVGGVAAKALSPNSDSACVSGRLHRKISLILPQCILEHHSIIYSITEILYMAATANLVSQTEEKLHEMNTSLSLLWFKFTQILKLLYI